MNLVLISTSDVGAGRSDVLDRMLRSVAQAAETMRPHVSIKVLLLLQKCPEYRYWTISKTLPDFVQAIPSVETLSLSAARNLLLGFASSNGVIDSRTVVGFPDDDCWYPAGTLEHVARSFAQSPQLGLWFCRYSSKPQSITQVNRASRIASPRDVIRQASSNTIFVRGRVLRDDAVFDETLGVGTANGGGEDTEFALRAWLSSNQSFYLPVPVIGHRDKTPQLRPKYYRGGLIALARHARQQPRIGVELARKLAVGVYLVGTRQLPVAAFRTAVSAAMKSRNPAAA
ncbi:MAG TPA: hypothetical protein VHD59_06235 [Pseudolabrys sp.]|nr:hypothetical protein [Pseudolabrys sp.]